MTRPSWTIGDRIRVLGLVAACASALAATISCSRPGGGGNTPAPTTATSSVSFKMSASGAPKCTADLRWEWEPVALTGTTGGTGKVTVPPSDFTSYNVPSSREGDNITCVMNADAIGDLATGQWRISLVSPVGLQAQCVVTLRAGANWAGFRQFVTTCKETPAGSLGFQYP